MKLCIWPIYELRGYGWLSVPLTDQEGRMMLALLAHREISEKILTEILWPQVFYMPDCWADSMSDCMKRLRRKLAWFNVTIVNRHSFGWHLEGV